jgi:hypothetical protein
MRNSTMTRAGVSRTAVACTVLLLATAALPRLAGAQRSYDQGDASIALDRLLPESLIASGQHRVTGVRRAGAYRMEFEIESEAAGTQSAESIALAVIRIQEARTLAQATNQFAQDNRELADEMRGQIRIGGDSVVDIVGSPLDTSSKVVGQFGRNVGQTLEELGQFPGPGARADTAGRTASEDPIFASHRRSVAGQLNLDVYSSNPGVQRFLDAMARARSGGLGRAGITTVSLARPAEVSVDGGRVQERIRSSVLNEEQGKLFERDRDLLLAAGVEPALAERLLSHPVLSPTHMSAITEYLAFMQDVGNRGAVVEAALDARDEVEALAKVQIVRMYAHYHESWTPLSSLLGAGRLALALNRDGALLVALPFDILEWTAETDRVFTGLASFAERKQVTGRAVLLSGVATPRAQAALEERGFEIFERFLFRR